MNLLTPTGYKDINDVNIGDTLVAYDIDTGNIIHNTLLDKTPFTYEMLEPIEDIYAIDEEGNQYLESSGRTSKQVFISTYGIWKFYKINNSITLFKNQSLWANDRVIHAKELQIGDTIYDDENNEVEVTSIEPVTDETIWWKLTVSGDHSFISEGFSLHNASRYWSGARSMISTAWNYTTGGTNWGSTSGLADNASVPSSTDDVTFDGAGLLGNSSSSITVNITIGSLTFTSGYTALISFGASITLTVAGNFTDNASHSWSVFNSTCYITISAASIITSNGKLWPGNIAFTNTNTKTLVGDWTASGQLYCSTTNATTTLNGAFTLSVAGYQSQFSSQSNGTGTIRITGGNMNLGGNNGQIIGVSNLILDGNITFITNMNIGTGTLLKYQSGIITNSSTTNIIFNGSNPIIDTGNVVWGIINFAGGATITLNSILNSIAITFSSNGGTTVFTGSFGFNIGTFTTASAANMTLKVGNNYIINTLLISPIDSTRTISSDSATLKATLILTNGASCNIKQNFTRIDASAGRTINTWNGVVIDSFNVRSFTDLSTVAKAIIQ